MSRAPVVVGVDGSESSLEAAGRAAREAAMRHRPLHVVHAFNWPSMAAVPSVSAVATVETGLRHLAERIVDEAVHRAHSIVPDVEIDTKISPGDPLSVLEKESRNAVLVAVGSRGLSAFTGLLAGSVAVHLAAHGRCPILVVRGRPEPSGGILVGVDGSPAGEAAVGFAFAEASLHRVKLIAMHVWNPWAVPVPPPPPGTAEPYASDPGALEDTEKVLLSEALAGWKEKYPDVEVEPRLVRGRVRQSLLEASSGAQLLVVGARGHGGFVGMLLGSVSQAMLYHADCPVAVVPHDAGPSEVTETSET